MTFRERLRKLGYRSYRAYLLSDHWKAVRARYRKSKRPQHCLVCHSPKYQLHHHTYERLGRERLSDFTPLCEYHHRRCHSYLRRHRGVSLGDVKVILEAIRPKRKRPGRHR